MGQIDLTDVVAVTRGLVDIDSTTGREGDCVLWMATLLSDAGYGVVDASVSYAVPVFRSLAPWVKVELFNVLDNDKQIAWNTVVAADPASPLDALGLPTGYVKGTNFGKATSNNHFITSLPGVPGGRTFRMSFGLRF